MGVSEYLRQMCISSLEDDGRLIKVCYRKPALLPPSSCLRVQVVNEKYATGEKALVDKYKLEIFQHTEASRRFNGESYVEFLKQLLAYYQGKIILLFRRVMKPINTTQNDGFRKKSSTHPT